MPSVGMRRSTRVFGARVLRSGRRLWTEPQESGSKYVRASHGENKWSGLLETSVNGGGDAGDRLIDMWQETKNIDSMGKNVGPKTEERASAGVVEEQDVDRMCGTVYRRKRQRMEDKMYGKKYARKQLKRKCRATQSFDTCEEFFDYSVTRFRGLAIVVNESSYDCGYWITCFLVSVLSYMSRVRIGMRRLAVFMLSKPIFDAYSSRGVLFLQDSVATKSPGICIISGSRLFIPLFSVDFSAIPSFFEHSQTSMYLRAARLTCLLVTHSLDVCDHDGDDFEEPFSQIPPGEDIISCNDVLVSDNDNSVKRDSSHSATGLPKPTLRNFQLRNSKKIQKRRRSSLRRKKGRPPPSFRPQKASGASLSSEIFKIRQEKRVQFSPEVPTRVLRSSDKTNSTTANIKELKSAVGVSTQDACTANLLITEPDKCYREEGVTLSLELSASKQQWFLAVMKDGTARYSLTAQKVMRPSSSNRFTHSVIWIADGGWKLEFPNKQDWLIFKELYKECWDRNMQLPAAASVIPVPGVQEVSISGENNHCKPYVRPDSYISVKDDELIRAMVKKSANYDMDSDDEEWLAKLNDEMYAGRDVQELVMPESFELIIDALEKGFHSNPDENFDEQAAYYSCMHLERREVVEAIRNYWVKKRKQKRSALVRIFQLYQPRRTQVIPKSILRKKRSFKRQASQAGRGKQRPFLQAIAAERDAFEQQSNVHKLQEAKAAADRYEGLAVLKRQRAQMLMENADLATYKAMMALRIAEAAQIAESAPDTVASLFLC